MDLRTRVRSPFASQYCQSGARYLDMLSGLAAQRQSTRVVGSIPTGLTIVQEASPFVRKPCQRHPPVSSTE